MWEFLKSYQTGGKMLDTRSMKSDIQYDSSLYRNGKLTRKGAHRLEAINEIEKNQENGIYYDINEDNKFRITDDKGIRLDETSGRGLGVNESKFSFLNKDKSARKEISKALYDARKYQINDKVEGSEEKPSNELQAKQGKENISGGEVKSNPTISSKPNNESVVVGDKVPETVVNEDIKKEQIFLNKTLGLNLNVNGIKDEAFLNARSTYHTKYDKVEKPTVVVKPSEVLVPKQENVISNNKVGAVVNLLGYTYNKLAVPEGYYEQNGEFYKLTKEDTAGGVLIREGVFGIPDATLTNKSKEHNRLHARKAEISNILSAKSTDPNNEKHNKEVLKKINAAKSIDEINNLQIYLPNNVKQLVKGIHYDYKAKKFLIPGNAGDMTFPKYQNGGTIPMEDRTKKYGNGNVLTDNPYKKNWFPTTDFSDYKDKDLSVKSDYTYDRFGNLDLNNELTNPWKNKPFGDNAYKLTRGLQTDEVGTFSDMGVKTPEAIMPPNLGPQDFDEKAIKSGNGYLGKVLQNAKDNPIGGGGNGMDYANTALQLFLAHKVYKKPVAYINPQKFKHVDLGSRSVRSAEDVDAASINAANNAISNIRAEETSDSQANQILKLNANSRRQGATLDLIAKRADVRRAERDRVDNQLEESRQQKSANTQYNAGIDQQNEGFRYQAEAMKAQAEQGRLTNYLNSIGAIGANFTETHNQRLMLRQQGEDALKTQKLESMRLSVKDSADTYNDSLYRRSQAKNEYEKTLADQNVETAKQDYINSQNRYNYYLGDTEKELKAKSGGNGLGNVFSWFKTK